MTRAPSYLDDNTSTFARTCLGFGKTAAEMAMAIEVYKTPRHRRPGTWWIAMAVVLAAIGAELDPESIEQGDPA